MTAVMRPQPVFTGISSLNPGKMIINSKINIKPGINIKLVIKPEPEPSKIKKINFNNSQNTPTSHNSHNSNSHNSSHNSNSHNSPISPPSKNVKTSSNGIAMRIVYPSIYDGLEFVEDDEWYEILNNIAYGIMPKDFTSRHNGIVYTASSREKRYQPSVDPEEAVWGTIDFIREVGHVYTTADINIDEEIVEEVCPDLWKNVKNKKKQILIKNYKKAETKRLNLTSQQEAEMYSLMSIGLKNGTISDDDIVFKDGEIKDIKSLTFDGQIYKFRQDASKRLKVYSNVSKDSSKDSSQDKSAKNVKKIRYTGRFVSFDKAEEKYKAFLLKGGKSKSGVFKSVRNCDSSRAESDRHGNSTLTAKELWKLTTPQIHRYNENNPLLSPRYPNFLEELALQN